MLTRFKKNWIIGLIAGLSLLLSLPTFAIDGAVLNPKEDVYILQGDIGMSFQNYVPLEARLDTAKKGDIIRIVTYKNAGGVHYTGLELSEHIMSSKATVITEARVWTASAALHVLFSGDYVIIHKTPANPIDEKDSMGVAHLSFLPVGENKLRTEASIAEDIKALQFYRHFLSDMEWYRVTKGRDVYLYGTKLCANSKFKVKETAEYCIIKGVK